MTRAIFLGGLLGALVTASSSQASADELNFAATSLRRPNILTARAGMEGALMGELGYRRVVGLFERNAALGLDVSAPVANLDTGDYRLRSVLAVPLLDGPHWKLIGALGPTMRSAENALNQSYALGADARFTGGYYSSGWFAAAEIGAELVGGAYIENSEKYRRYVYAGAKDGWYRDTGGTLYAGLHGGVSFSGVDIVLRLGRHSGSSLEAKSMPFYSTVGVNVALP